MNMTDPRHTDPRDEAFDTRDENTRDGALDAAREPQTLDARTDDARDRGRILDVREHEDVRNAQVGQRAGAASVRLLALSPFREFVALAAKGKGEMVDKLN